MGQNLQQMNSMKAEKRDSQSTRFFALPQLEGEVVSQISRNAEEDAQRSIYKIRPLIEKAIRSAIRLSKNSDSPKTRKS